MHCRDDSKTSKAPIFTFTQDSEPSDKVRKDKKKKQHKNKRDFRDFRNSITLATGVNIIEVEGKKKRKIYDVFHVSLLKQDIIKKGRVDENVTQLEFEVNDEQEYKVKDIQNSAIYAKVSKAGHLSRFYYLIS